MALNSHNPTATSRPRWTWIALIALVIVVLSVYLSSGKREIPVRTATVQRGTLRSQISTNGKVEPVSNFEAHSPGPTTVRRVLVREGQHVKQGQLLMELDDSDARTQAARAQAQLRAAEADLNNVRNGGAREDVLSTDAELIKARTDRDAAQRNYDAMQRLQPQGAASEGEVRDARNQLDRAQAQLTFLEQKRKDRYAASDVARVEAQVKEARAVVAAANELLSKSNIRAPQSGGVYFVPVRPGSFVGGGELLLSEADLSHVLVRSFVDEPDVGRLAPRQPIEITWDAMPGRIWTGTVNMVPASVKLLGSRNVGELTCIVENADLKLLPNINVSVSIITADRENVLYVPREAVHQDGGKSYVYQIVDGKLQRRDIETGSSNLTQIEVRGVAQDAVVALGATTGRPLTNGAPVKVATE